MVMMDSRHNNKEEARTPSKAKSCAISNTNLRPPPGAPPTYVNLNHFQTVANNPKADLPGKTRFIDKCVVARSFFEFDTHADTLL